jgi:glycosyltransferase involved in cell wall biosynthesis
MPQALEPTSSSLSIIVLTKNEEQMIYNCLRTCTWANELIVVDSLSTDRTVDIAREFTDKVFSVEWLGYGEQRNKAMEFASGEWILFVDADERVSYPLREEICALLERGTFHKCYKVPRYNYYLGKRLKYGTFYPDAQPRLFHKDSAHYAAHQYVHEVPDIEGSTGQLENPLFHLSHRSISTVLKDLDNYTTLQAQKGLVHKTKPVRVRTIVWVWVRNSWNQIVRWQAWRDGMEGLVEHMLVLAEGLITQAKMWELQTKDYDVLYEEIEAQIWQSIESGEPLP